MYIKREELIKYFLMNKDSMNDRIRHGIENNRKEYLRVILKDKDGKPVEGAHVAFTQKNHEFRYGANIFLLDEMESDEKNEGYRQYFKEAFNLATLPFFWKDLEPEKGKPRYAKDSPKRYRRPAPDLCLEYCEENGIEPKAHCLNYLWHAPSWMPYDLTASKRAISEHFAELAERYAHRIKQWEVINETICGGGWLDKMPIDISPDLIEWSFAEARRYFPNNELVLNEGTHNIWKGFLYNRSHYYLLAERALRNGASIDTIGMQYHMFDSQEVMKQLNREYYNPRMIYEIMDQYSCLQRPFQLTEVTIPAYGNSEEEEALQAEIIKYLYSIWFSHKNCNGVIYWNLVDGYCYTGHTNPGDMTSGENVHYGGLIRFDMTPKPSFYTIRDLFRKEWITNGEGVTDEGGVALYKSFFGDYDITVTKDGVTKTYPVSFLGRGTKKFELTF